MSSARKSCENNDGNSPSIGLERMQVDDDDDDGEDDNESDDDDDDFVGSLRRDALDREGDHVMARAARAGTSKKRVEELAGRGG